MVAPGTLVTDNYGERLSVKMILIQCLPCCLLARGHYCGCCCKGRYHHPETAQIVAQYHEQKGAK